MESLSVESVLGLIGIVILIGLAGELFFKKTAIPSGLFLIALGMVIGPGFHVVDTRTVYSLAPYFGTLALLIILFDGGLNLPLLKVLKEAPLALLFSLVVFVSSAVAIAWLYVWALNGPWIQGLLLGAIVGGTTPVIVMPLVSQLHSIREPTQVLLSLESAIADVFVVVSALAVMGMMTERGDAAGVARHLFHAFVDALLLAALAGAVWARLLGWLKGQPLSYMLTLAAVLLLYDVAEILQANGVMTILLFGLVLGNMQVIVGWVAEPIRRLVGFRLTEAEFVLDEFLKRLNEELSFLVRTFFYVLLGLIFDVSTMTLSVLAIGTMMFCALLLVRWGTTEAFAYVTNAWTPSERRIIVSMLPRGVAVAVMSFLPTSKGIPETDVFPVYALLVIVLSILFMTMCLAFERRLHPTEVATVPTSHFSRP